MTDNLIINREHWLGKIKDQFAPTFEALGHKLPKRLQP